jgi:hypothetical protein
MQNWVVQENDYHGDVNQISRSRHNFYSYSLWRAKTGEHLFDGVAGDLAEALDSLRAHIHYLCANERAVGLAGD